MPNIIQNLSWLLWFALPLLIQQSCKPQLTDFPIPLANFPDFTINLNLPEYITLKSDGGTKYVDGGVRGLIIYRSSATSYIVYERTCSYHPNDACATVEVDVSNLFLKDVCCGSTFTMTEGTPNGGPAWRPLRQYRVILDATGTSLTITSDSQNGM